MIYYKGSRRFSGVPGIPAGMAESADATDSKSVFSNEVRVQVPFPALTKKKPALAKKCRFLAVFRDHKAR